MAQTFENAMKKAFPTQPVPEALQTRMLYREQAVRQGREAEQALTGEKVEDSRGLMAKAIVGRMALLKPLPEGVSPQRLGEALQKTEAFARYTAQPLEDQLAGLQDKSFLKEFAPQRASQAQQDAPAPQTQKGMTL